MSRSLSLDRKVFSGSSLAIAVVLFFAINILAAALFSGARIDLTENRLYTLSDGTKNILKNLNEPITLRLYISKGLLARVPGISVYANRVEEMLQEYQRASNGKLKLTVLDPEPFSEEEDRAVGYGLQGVPVDDSGSTTFYLGLAGTNSVDSQEVISFFQPDKEAQLEYELTQLVYRLAQPKQPVVGVLSTIPLFGSPQAMFQGGGAQPLVITDQLQQTFQLKELEKDVKEIPKDVDVLMLVHPKDLSDSTLYAIDQFILKGGRALVFVDPYAEADAGDQNPMMAMQTPKGSNLTKLFDAWGIKMLNDVVAADMQTAKKVQFNNRGPRPVIIDYPIWMDVAPEQMDRSDVVTGNLSHVTFASAGALEKSKDATVNFQPLMKTSKQASTINTSRLGPMADPQDLVRSYQPEGEFVVAARITGKVKSAFPGGAPAEDKAASDNEEKKDSNKEKTSNEESLKESKADINVIVVADSDLLQDRFWVDVRNFFGQRIAVPNGANGNFVIGALDNLTGSNDLISVRNRSGQNRPFTRVRSLQQEAEQAFLTKEKQLQDQLRETEQKIGELQRGKSASDQLILSDEQRKEIERFKDEKLRIRKELRNVQHELNKNIESLENVLKFVNIWLMPVLVGIGGFVLSGYRAKRRLRTLTITKTQEASA